MSTSFALPVAGDDRRWGLSFGLALLAELSLLGGLWWLGQQVRPAPPPPMQIELAPPAQPAPPKVLPKPPRPRPVVQHQQARPQPEPLPQPQVVTPPAPVPQSKPAMPVAAVKPPPPAPTQPDANAVKLSFEAQLRDAIQSAVRFPETARMMHLSGRTLVAFDWQDGRISHLRVVRSSGADTLDHAALHTVQMAPYPATPSVLAGRLMSFQIWVQFNLHES